MKIQKIALFLLMSLFLIGFGNSARMPYSGENPYDNTLLQFLNVTHTLNGTLKAGLNGSFNNFNVTNNLIVIGTINATWGKNLTNFLDNQGYNKSVDLSGYNKGGVINKSEYVQFSNINMTNWQSPDGGNSLTLSDDGSDTILLSNVGGINSFIISTTGTFLEMVANPGVGNDFLMFSITETQGDDTQINFFEGGAGRARLQSSGSVSIGGDATTSSCDGTFVDCDASSTGADLVLHDDFELNGSIYALKGNINLTDAGNIKINGTIYINGGEVNKSIDLSSYNQSVSLDSYNHSIDLSSYNSSVSLDNYIPNTGGDFSGNYNHTSGNMSMAENATHCYGWSCEGQIYYNGSSLVIQVT